MRSTITILLALLTLTAAGCGGKAVTTTTFDEPDKMTASTQWEGAYMWKKQDVNPADYDTMIIHPVEVAFDRADEKYEDLDDTELDLLALYARKVMIKALNERFEMVKQPKDGTLVLRVAITDVEPSVPAMNTVSSVMPVGIVLSFGRKMVTGKHAWVGEVEYELEFTDGKTGEVLTMVRHRAYGEKWDLEGIIDDLGHVRTQFDKVAKTMREKLGAIVKE